MDLQKIFEKIFEKNLAKHFLLSIISGLTLLFLTSMVWNLYQNHLETIERARIEARTIFQHNLAYRRWNSMHGGVYARVTEQNQPNPYLRVADRDLTTQSGTRLTMINPFQMTRQAYDLLRRQNPDLAAINRTVSLEPVNPVNRPDEWEEKGLLAFETGENEISEVTEINGHRYMRVLTPYITEERCLKCHSSQGYTLGDIRGGMSIAVPMQPYFETAVLSRRIIVISHLVLWLLGIATTVLLSNSLKKYHKAITESEKKFRIVSEFAYNFEMWIKENNEIVFISPSCARITGYSRQEFIDDPNLMIEIIHPEDREAYQAHLVDLKAPLHEDEHFRIITKSGQIRWISHTCSPIFVEGQFLGRRGSNKDITDKKRLQEQLMQTQKVECLGHFAGGIAHDFNNVLSSIVTFTHLLRDETEGQNSELDDYVKHIMIAAKLGRNMTSNLLSFGRRQIGNPKTVRLNTIINDINDIIKVLMNEDIILETRLSENEIPVFADPHQIEQVLINLCTNARDAMPNGGKLRISTKLMLLEQPYKGKFSGIPPGSYMLLTVSDTGSGIDTENLPHICEPFFTTKDSCRGTGLGLSIIWNIIKQHNGYIDIDSSKGKGSNFTIYLAASPPDCEEKSALSAPAHGPAGRNTETILLADDDELARRSLNTFLRQQGYNIILAEDGLEAVNKFILHRDSIDLVILDVLLAKKNGREVYDIIKKDRQALKVLFISGYTDDIITEKGIHEEGLEFLPKPLDIEAFIIKVRDILGSS